MVFMLSSFNQSVVQPHIEGMKRTIQGNVNTVKQHPLPTLGLAATTIAIAKKFPKLAAAANIGLVGSFTAGILREEYEAATALTPEDKTKHYIGAGKEMLNAGIMALGFKDALKTVTAPVVSKMRSGHWATALGLAEDSLMALNVPQDDNALYAESGANANSGITVPYSPTATLAKQTMPYTVPLNPTLRYLA
jgi:hypothetical protein